MPDPKTATAAVKPRQRKATINPNNLEEMLRSSDAALRMGQRQWFTPEPYAGAFSLLLHKADTVVDLQMGAGALLAGCKAVQKIGADIDVDCARKPSGATGDWSCLAADITLLAPILDECKWQADTFALNPPFSLPWDASRLAFLADSKNVAVRETFARSSKSGRIDSSLATYLLALHFSSIRGEGYIVMNEATAMRFFGDPNCPARRHIWLWLSFPGSIFPETGGDLGICILYFAADHNRGKPHHVKGRAIGELPAQMWELRNSRYSLRGGTCVNHAHENWHATMPYFKTAREEYQVRHGGRKSEFNIWLDGNGIIRTHLTPFQSISGRIPEKLVKELDALKNQSPLALVVQKASRDALRTAVNSDVWLVDPQLPAMVDQAIRDYNSVRAPFYPLSEIQRIGYLDESSQILCRKHGLPGFTKGQSYALSSTTVSIGGRAFKMNAVGEEDEIEITGSDLQITVVNGTEEPHRFMHKNEMLLPEKGWGRRRTKLPLIEGRVQEDPNLHDLQTLIEYFEIPDVPDIASLRTGEYHGFIGRLAELEARANALTGTPFAYKNFQRDDIARLCLHDGGICSWQAGLGKTLGALTWQLLKGGRLNLIVAPDSLHQQITGEAMRFFGIRVKPLMNQQAFHDDELLQEASRRLTGTGKLPVLGEDEQPHFYITSYTALGMNGGDEWEPKVNDAGDLVFNQQRIAARRQSPGFIPEYEANIGVEKTYDCGLTVRCVWSPTLSTLTRDLFDCVAVDEGVRIKGTDTYIATGVRRMRPRFRLVLTATPIKNRLEDIFWLAWWVCGGTDQPNPRWPYENSHEARELFANEHSLSERNLTKEEKAAEAGARRSCVKRTPQICNIHRLWKLLGPVVIRRRKEDIGEDIAVKKIIPIRVTAGTAQQRAYKHHLDHGPEYSKDGVEMSIGSQIAVQLGLLRQAALCPDSANLAAYGGGKAAVSWTDLTTKGAAALSIIAERLPLGEQVILMSPFQHASEHLHRRLREAGVNACLLDGNMSPKKRGDAALAFKQQRYSVMVAGIKAMGEGHSFACCNNLIRLALEWAFDINDQSADRVHRLDSPRDVNIYDIITANTVEERLASLYHEKGDSANLALDGRLFADKTEEVNLAQLLRDAIRDFDPKAATIDENQIHAEWPELAKKLRLAQAAFDQWHPPIAELPLHVRATSANLNASQSEVADAIRMLAEPAADGRRRNGRREVKRRTDVFAPSVTDTLRELLDAMEDLDMPE
jgi:hypothetical protein